ncbi:hypothetical protein JD969_05570 [Planctomycetota bacterium]|nr:hypothetical protein JD969_05570 [Planctomycetota bacterium]
MDMNETDYLMVRVGRWWGRLVLLCIAVGVAFGLWARWIHIDGGKLFVAWLVVGVVFLISSVYQLVEIDGVSREVRWKWLLFGFLVLWTKKMGFDRVDGVKMVKDSRGSGADAWERWTVAVMLDGKYVEVQRYEDLEMTGEGHDKAGEFARGLSDMMRVPLTYGFERGGELARGDEVDDDYDDDEGAWL